MISVENLHLTYRGRSSTHNALRGVGFDLEPGQFLTLLGPSGCGKTTLLRSIAGLETPDSGRILIDGKPVFASDQGIDVPTARRNLGMVFQSYAIWPHMSVFENAAFPLRYRGDRKGKAAHERVMECLTLVRLDHLADRPAPLLSGGQQQRLALARALAAEPTLLLLDEPLSNLDARLREEMRFELRSIVNRTGVTTIFVTHEQTEALSMSDVVAVMNEGEIAQIGRPRDLYRQPASEFVATFFVRSNLLPARVIAGFGSTVRVVTSAGEFLCHSAHGTTPDMPMTVVLKPETISLERVDRPDDGSPGFGQIEEMAFLGDAVECAVRLGSRVIVAKLAAGASFERGDRVRVIIEDGQNSVFPSAETAAPVSNARSQRQPLTAAATPAIA